MSVLTFMFTDIEGSTQMLRDLGPDYEFAVVGHPSRDYLWILSRSPRMPDSVYAGILERLRQQQYRVERLRKTLQAG